MQQVSKILFCLETLHVSGFFYAHHQELLAVHVAIGMWPLPRTVRLEQPDSP